MTESNGKIRNLKIYCTKTGCKFSTDWDDVTLEEVKEYYKKWNEKHGKLMACVHDYEFAERAE